MGMTMRERMLAVVQEREHDRVPFVQYDGLAAPNEDVWALVGRDNMGLLRWSAVHRIDHPHCSLEVEPFERRGIGGRRTVMHTPAGELVQEELIQATYGAASIKKHFVQQPEDYRVLLAYLRDSVVSEDVDRYLRDVRELGEDGLPLVAVSRTPYQQLWIQWVELQDLCAHLVECPELLAEVTSVLADIERQVYRVVRRVAGEVRLPFVDVPDNITAPVIGLRYFERYCVPLYNELSDMLAEVGVPVVVHMDGDLRPLWQAITASRVGGLDSFSPSPDNDTSVAEARALWPDRVLWVNFPSSVHLAEPEVIYRQARRILEEDGASGRLWIQVSENVPPGVWRRSLPEIMRAIEDSGRRGV